MSKRQALLALLATLLALGLGLLLSNLFRMREGEVVQSTPTRLFLPLQRAQLAACPSRFQAQVCRVSGVRVIRPVGWQLIRSEGSLLLTPRDSICPGGGWTIGRSGRLYVRPLPPSRPLAFPRLYQSGRLQVEEQMVPWRLWRFSPREEELSALRAGLPVGDNFIHFEFDPAIPSNACSQTEGLQLRQRARAALRAMLNSQFQLAAQPATPAR